MSTTAPWISAMVGLSLAITSRTGPPPIEIGFAASEFRTPESGGVRQVLARVPRAVAPGRLVPLVPTDVVATNPPPGWPVFPDGSLLAMALQNAELRLYHWSPSQGVVPDLEFSLRGTAAARVDGVIRDRQGRLLVHGRFTQAVDRIGGKGAASRARRSTMPIRERWRPTPTTRRARFR